MSKLARCLGLRVPIPVWGWAKPHLTLDRNWNEKEEIKINTWAETFDLGNNSRKPDRIRNIFCSRLSPRSRKFVAKDIKSRLSKFSNDCMK